ncbi:MAG: ArnT family glycosyltransferase, partial [Terriglobales bacterium]
MNMNAPVWTRRIAWLFAVGGVLALLAGAAIVLQTPEQLAHLLEKLLGSRLQSPADVAATLKQTPKILLRGAAALLGFAGLGFLLLRCQGSEGVPPAGTGDRFRMPPLAYTLASGALALGIGLLLVSPRLGGSLWCDEASHASCALDGSWLHPWLVGSVVNMRPYSYVMRVLTTLFGFSETLLRLPSMLTYCAFGWFIAVAAWNEQNRWLSGVAGVALQAAFLAAPGAIYTAAQARGHMPAAVLLAVGLWCFVCACGQADPRRWLRWCLLCLGLSISMVMTSLAGLAAVWLAVVASLATRRPLLPRHSPWFYNAAAVTIAAVLVVYAPVLPRFVLWMGSSPQWRAFGMGTILPWTTGWLEFVPLAVLTWFFIQAARKEWALSVVPLSAVAIWALLFAQHHAKFIYAAGSGTTLALLGALSVCRLEPLRPRQQIAWAALAVLVASAAFSLDGWLDERKHFVPESMARDQVAPIRKGDGVLLIGHCEAPRFYL